MPPPTEIFSELQSTLSKSGWLASAMNSVLTAGKLWNLCCDKSLSTAGRSRGFAIRMLQPRLRLQQVRHQVPVQQHGTLADTRGAAGVLQHGDVVGHDLRRRVGAAPAL